MRKSSPACQLGAFGGAGDAHPEHAHCHLPLEVTTPSHPLDPFDPPGSDDPRSGHLCAGLLREVESRAGRPEYMRLLAECHNLYAQARLALIGPYVQQRITQYSTLQLPLFTRNGCEHLGRVGARADWD
jgi:hypothetical protein